MPFTCNSSRSVCRTCDVLIFEEAEHILWNQVFYGRLKKAKYTLGIIHTNYQERGKYSVSPFNLRIRIFLAILPYYNAWICQRNCDRVIAVSRSIKYAAPLSVAPINGIREVFIKARSQLESDRFEKDFYYLGSVAWEKNLKQLIDFCQSCQVAIDIYGSGTNYGRGSTLDKIMEYSRQHGDYLNFRGSTAEPHTLNKDPVPLLPSELEQLGWKKKVQLLLSKFIPSTFHLHSCRSR